ncbi:MAG: glycosyltransferase family 4 protein [Oscillospiraceae bacterium]|nr:glycosyltransferase family 4 protein [Oscillospiraceae bacterium]
MKKKVLFAATVVKTHIMEFHIPYLKMFREMGWETAVAARNDYEDPADCLIPYCDAYYDIPIERLPWKLGNIGAYRQMKQLIDRESYDVIHCHTPMGAMIARLAAIGARKKGTKVLYTAHGFHFYKGASLVHWLAYYPVEWVLAHVTDVLITMNREDFALAQKKMHAKRIEYIPGVGIDTGKFQAGSAGREEKRRELGFSETDFLILTVAEMTKNKNHSTVLKALALLKDTEEFASMQYLICGRGDNEGNLRQEAQELGVSEHVVFLGYRQDVPDLLRCSDLFAFMSFREGLPVALMEAMSSGLAVICSRIRGNTDLIDDGAQGMIVDNTPQAVAEGILKLYRDPELRRRYGVAAAEKVKLFDAENVHRIMKEIYTSVEK